VSFALLLLVLGGLYHLLFRKPIADYRSGDIPSACWRWAGVHEGSIGGILMSSNMGMLYKLCKRPAYLFSCAKVVCVCVCVQSDG
jgi:hypothetical protein